MIFCIDLENVHATGLTGVEFLNDKDHFIVFYSVSTPYVENSVMNTILASGCTFDAVKLMNSGKNALDFYICAKVGEIVSNRKDEEIAIIARDKGYTALIDYVENYSSSGCNIFMAETIRDALLNSRSDGKRKFAVQESVKRVSIENTYNQILASREVSNLITETFQGTRFEDSIDEIMAIFQAKQSDKKGMYLDSIKTFGREAGCQVYGMLKMVA